MRVHHANMLQGFFDSLPKLNSIEIVMRGGLTAVIGGFALLGTAYGVRDMLEKRQESKEARLSRQRFETTRILADTITFANPTPQAAHDTVQIMNSVKATEEREEYFYDSRTVYPSLIRSEEETFSEPNE